MEGQAWTRGRGSTDTQNQGRASGANKTPAPHRANSVQTILVRHSQRYSLLMARPSLEMSASGPVRDGISSVSEESFSIPASSIHAVGVPMGW